MFEVFLASSRCAWVYWAVLPLALLCACTAPAAYGRTGTILAPGHVRLSASDTIGIAPTSARIRYPPDATRSAADLPEGTYYDYSPSKWHSLRTPVEIVVSPIFSYEIQASISFFPRCEFGALASLGRVGGEIRCGLLQGDLGPIEAALSVGLAQQVVVKPLGIEQRIGLDLSLAGRLTPILDVYLSKIPWSRSVNLMHYLPAVPGNDNPVEFPRTERDEWRLSIPIGVAVREPTSYSTFGAVVAVIPEITLWTHAEKDYAGNTYPSSAMTRVTQRWAVFLIFRLEKDFGAPVQR